MRNTKAFTLIEIIVAVALVAILSAAIAPSVLNNIAQGRIARADSDVFSLATAIMQFRQEVGKFPNLQTPTFNPATPGSDAVKIKFLATRGPVNLGIGETGSGDDHWAPAIAAADPPNDSDGEWDLGKTAGFLTGDIEDFQSHLIEGLSISLTDNEYPRVPAGFRDHIRVAGFRSAVITSDPLDPWGSRYLCNAAGLGLTGETVWVISAGPDKIFNTFVDADGINASPILGGDDIGVKVQ